MTYTPPDGFAGVVTFEYRVCDLPCGGGASVLCSTATVTITVSGEAPLPRTGHDVDRIALLGLILLAGGALLLASGRRAARR
jgi:LPXTG-motif cell wall-anchored protein